MAEMLKDWLSQRLQRPISWQAEEFGDKMKNGHIIASVLQSYYVINDDKYYLIRPSNLEEDVKRNWNYLKEWLRDIEIIITDVDLKSIMEGKGSTLLRLFYQLFLHLDKRDRTNFIKQERKAASKLIDKLDHRFVVEKLPEVQEPSFDDLSKPILDHTLFIKWQKKKAKEVEEVYNYMKYKYSKVINKIEESNVPFKRDVGKRNKMSSKDKREIEKFSMKYPCEFHNYTYEELLELEQKASERKRTLIDSDSARNYLDNLYTKMHIKADSEQFQKQMSNAISGSLWDMTVAEEESKLDAEFAKKVMKLSQFEKQMCTQIMETKQQARNLIKNRIAGETEFIDQRTQQFEQYLDNVKEEINSGLGELDFEKQRQSVLHKKLYSEKMKRKRQHYYEICYDTMLSIVDFAVKYAYFKKLLEDDIPKNFLHEWKQLYYKQQPIFDILEPMENILKESQDDEENIQQEHIIHLELDRQEALNESEFTDYHNYLYPWTLDCLIPNYDPESEERKYEQLGEHILGHVVYTLLEIKYPYPPQRLPANLPNFSSKAIVRGIPDKPVATAMQTLLLAKKVHVVRLECAINYCLRKFKSEMVGCTDIELSYDKFIAVAQEQDKDVIKLMKSEDELLSKNNDVSVTVTSGQLIANVKQTQTPKTIPEEDISLSESANLGRYAYECLNFGDSLTDHLICAIIVEYIKGQEDINGFVIINYPNSYREAQILEETFSGLAPPDDSQLEGQDDIYLEESIIKHRKKEKDEYKELRISNLVNDPHKKHSYIPFSSYFTCYLKLQESEDILKEFFIWNLTNENSELIDRFYAIMGINYSMYYEVIEKYQLALICKYIIGDYTMHLKSTDKLFGENVLSTLDFPSSDDKRAKSKLIKPEGSNGKSKDTLRRSSKQSRLSFSNELKIVKEPDSSTNFQEEILFEMNELENEDKASTTTTTSIEIKLLAGEEDWIYGDSPVPEDIGIALSTCWEEIEKNYIKDMQQLFFANRLQMNCIIPYVRFIRDKMEQIITLPSRKQDLVSRFQKEYNDFENDWRDIQLTKNEWHCRVKQLQDNLFKICDERKIFAEQQKKALICENWTMEELTLMANTYISCMQTELNRFILTYQILHDFYFIMLKRSPPSDRLVSKELTKILRESDETSGSKKGAEDKIFRQLKNYFQDMQMKNIEVDYSNSPFNMIIENNVKFGLKVIKDVNDSYRSLISREYSEIAKIVPSAKKKEGNTSEESISSEEVFKSNALKCIEEWTMGINGEMFRASLRLLVLQYKCYTDMKIFNDNICKAFSDIQDDINNYYLNEIRSVDRLCKYLQIAVENGKRVPESLILEDDLLLIDPNMLQYFELRLEADGSVTKEFVLRDKEFKISQLARLRDQFKILAPTGISLQKSFIYLIQDFIFFGRESCAGPMFPEAWKRVDPEQISKLVFSLFGETSFVDWRDFLIYCLNIRFPTLDELLLLRKKFRCEDLDSTELISRNKFIEESLWFEQDIDVQDRSTKLRNVLTKHFLFELFECDENLMNYSAFLLAFCKGSNPIEGFVMALSMAIGKQLCYLIEECEEVICKLIKDKRYKDECLACAKKCAAQFLEKLLINVLNNCEGITVVELEYTETIPEVDKKGRKGKTGAKPKKVESARTPKAQKSNTSGSKISPSTIDVQSTYICKPCEKDIEASEKLPEEEEIIKEVKIEPEPDPNLAYAVSQSVIHNVLNICLPWYFTLTEEEGAPQHMEYIEEVLKRLEDDTDNKDIYVCKFVSDPNICKLLRSTKKFVAVNLSEEINKVSM